MPATNPPVSAALGSRLAVLGSSIRRRRKRLKVSAVAAAEAAGMSRVTLHRIERGEPSVTMGAYLSAAAALGLDLQLIEPPGPPGEAAPPPLPERVRVADYPELQRLAWQTGGATELTPREALDLYERNWRHVDRTAMPARERELVAALQALGGGRLLV